MWGQICMSALQHQETEWTLPLAALIWWTPSVRPSEDEKWYHRTVDFTDGATEKFEALFFGDGKVYESIRTSREDSMEAELRYL